MSAAPQCPSLMLIWIQLLILVYLLMFGFSFIIILDVNTQIGTLTILLMLGINGLQSQAKQVFLCVPANAACAPSGGFIPSGVLSQ